MQYRFFGAFSGWKLLCLLVLLLLFPLGLNSCVKLVRRQPPGVSEGVMLDGKQVGNLTAAEAEVFVSKTADACRIAPVNAAVDEMTGGVIPDLNGLEVDIGQTMEKLLQAESGQNIQPVYLQLPAKKNLEAYPLHPVYQGNPEKPQVTFLINVAWGNEYLEQIIRVLQEADVQATFFLVGRWVNGNQKEAKMIAESGFEIASHGYSDAISMQEAGKATIQEDITKAADMIETVCGKRPVYFSPHRGELSPLVLETAAEQNIRVVMWTVDTVDWQLPGVDVMLDKIITKSGGGSLILMHPTVQTADFLQQVIPKLRQKGLEPVNLTELLSPIRVLKE